MLEPCGDFDLAEEAVGAEAGGQVRAQDLDGDHAVMLQVLRQVHRSHAALPQRALEAVAVVQGFGEAGRDVGHEASGWGSPQYGARSGSRKVGGALDQAGVGETLYRAGGLACRSRLTSAGRFCSTMMRVAGLRRTITKVFPSGEMS